MPSLRVVRASDGFVRELAAKAGRLAERMRRGPHPSGEGVRPLEAEGFDVRSAPQTQAHLRRLAIRFPSRPKVSTAVSLAPPSFRMIRASDRIARELVTRITRWLLIGLGGLLVIAGFLIAPLPGPLGLPLTVVGLMLVLRNSFAARRQFVRLQRAQPKMVFPIRRLLRREPEVVLVFWQQALRIERLIVPKRHRFCVSTRRRLKARLRRQTA